MCGCCLFDWLRASENHLPKINQQLDWLATETRLQDDAFYADGKIRLVN